MKIFFFSFLNTATQKKFHSHSFTVWAVSLQLHSDFRGQGVIRSAIVILQESRWGQNLVHNQKGICCWVLLSWFQCLVRIFRSEGEKKTSFLVQIRWFWILQKLSFTCRGGQLKSAQIASMQDFPLKHQSAKALYVILNETISVCGLTVATCRL